MVALHSACSLISDPSRYELRRSVTLKDSHRGVRALEGGARMPLFAHTLHTDLLVRGVGAGLGWGFVEQGPCCFNFIHSGLHPYHF